MDVSLFSSLVGVAGIVIGVAGFSLSCLTAFPTLMSKNQTVKLIGCKFLATACLFAVLSCGMVGPILNFSPEMWLVYRVLVVITMIFVCVTVYRLYRNLASE